MTRIDRDMMPGHTGTSYVSTLPKDLAENPNCRRAISEDLYTAVVNSSDLRSEVPVALTTLDLDPLRKQILNDLDELKNPYHARWHTEEVIQCVDLLAQNTNIPVDRELLLLAALFHDYGHCGQTYRQLDRKVQHSNMSNEEFAALTADNYLKDALSVQQRVELQGLILATSFGQANPATLPEVQGTKIQRDYSPTSPSEKLIAFADIGRFMLGLENHRQGSLKMLEESGKIPENYETWLAGEKGFLGYVQMRLDQIKDILTSAGAKLIQSKLEDLKNSYETVSQDGGAYKRQYEEVVARMQRSAEEQ